MPVYKFNSLEEAEKALWTFSPDDKYYQRLSQFFELATTIKPLKYPLGVFKYKTFAEANSQKNAWDLKFLKSDDND
jgi:hypothetical protein